jgi:GNAT superfamily N-acetyltransferase
VALVRLEPLDAPTGHSTEPGAQTWSASRALGRARELRRRDGLRRALSGVGAELGYRRLLLLVRRLETVRAPTAAIELDFGTIDSFEEYSQLRDDLDRVRFEERIRSGAVALCAREGGAPISVTWAGIGVAPMPYLGAWMRSDQGSVLLFDTLTRPDRRGLGVSPALDEWAAARYAAQGRRRMVTQVLPENRPSRRAHARSGFEPAALAVRIGTKRRPLLLTRPLAPWEGRVPR